jgi:hypothetical protein
MQTTVTSTCHLASKNESFIISFSFQSTLHDRFSTYFFVEFQEFNNLSNNYTLKKLVARQYPKIEIHGAVPKSDNLTGYRGIMKLRIRREKS